MSLSSSVAQIGRQTGRDMLVMAATGLDLELLPPLYDLLSDRKTAPLDVLLFSRGGSITAAYRIARMLRTFASEIRFIVPDRCESAATALVLSGDSILAGPASVFSPIDPSIHGDAGSANVAGAVAAEDIRLFPAMTKAWFGLDDETAQRVAVEVLTRHFFPPTLSALYRSNEETRHIAGDLIRLGGANPAAADPAINALLSGYGSHGYPITREELRELGLPVQYADDPERLGWPIVSALREQLGPGAVDDVEQGWCDAILVFGKRQIKRKRAPNGPTRWEIGEV